MDYTKEINILEEKLDRYETSSDIIFDEAYFDEIKEFTDKLHRKITDDDDLNDKDKAVLSTLVFNLLEKSAIHIRSDSNLAAGSK